MKVMTNPELIDKLYEEISRQNTIYMSIIGTMVAVVLGIAFAYVWQQLKFSDKGIEKMKRNIYEEFKIDKIKRNIDETKSNNDKSKENIDKLQKQIDEFNSFRKENVAMLLITHAEQFSLIASNAEEILLNNELSIIEDIIVKYGDYDMDLENFMSVFASVSNGNMDILNRKFKDADYKMKIKKELKTINDYLINNFPKGIKAYKVTKSGDVNFVEDFKKTAQKIENM
ncbi:hypothetical protein DY123_07565 [Apilactobacillus micheneri]|uniref:hypothetical protein n=1 Tax=Apilactobacillus micheneri TaxID=1899430 RepID=UPI00112A17C2|nr:hypothetical protein [Apilactobacillus micheneri]TPR41194.1 hypothetical protein DY123_07565 [Apilactobacillus micheneri]